MEKEKEMVEAIIKVIAFFDIFDFPLTSFEIWQYLGMKCELAEVLAILNEVIQPPLPLLPGRWIESKNGFYFLAGRSQIINLRLERYNFTDRKFKRARLIARIFKIIPWIKMMAVSNLMGAHNLKDESDIDWFIITQAGRLWLTRFFCAAFIKLLGLRPTKSQARDKICLSFFISDDNLALNHLRLKAKKEQEKDDIYFTYWLAGLAPIYNLNRAYEEFISANSWLFEQLPNWQAAGQSRRRASASRPSAFYREVIDLFIGGLEQPPQLGFIQFNFMVFHVASFCFRPVTISGSFCHHNSRQHPLCRRIQFFLRIILWMQG